MEAKTIQKVHEITNHVHENAKEYYLTRPLVTLESSIVLPSRNAKHTFKLAYDIKDVLTIGALTNSSVLMTGGTDRGKTTIAKLVMNALFADKWHRLDIDTDFGKSMIEDVDFTAIQEGKKTSEMYSLQKFLSHPGLILDEMNRSHSKISNKLLRIFDGDGVFSNGERAKLGVKDLKGNFYQFRVAAINEGQEYGGTFEIDQALRRRNVIEVPLDIFPLTPQDRYNIRRSRERDLNGVNSKSYLDDILTIKDQIAKLPMQTVADMYIAYLESFDYCKNSPTKDKGGVEVRGGNLTHICSPTEEAGCEFYKSFENHLCPHVRGVSAGISKNIIAVAQGFSALRATKFAEMVDNFSRGIYTGVGKFIISEPAKFENSLQEFTQSDLRGGELAGKAVCRYIENLSVLKEDIEAAFCFVGYSKVGISQGWIKKHYQGNRFEALRAFLKSSGEKFTQGLVKYGNEIEQIVANRKIPNNISDIENYCTRENPWLWKVIEPYLEQPTNGTVMSLPLLYGYGSG